MSSWVWGSKISNFWQVGDFSIFESKSSLFIHVSAVILKIILGFKHLHCPFGVQGRFTREARRAEIDGLGWEGWDGMGWMDGMGWDGISKVSFNILHTWWVYR